MVGAPSVFNNRPVEIEMKKIEIIADVERRLSEQGFGGLYNSDGPCCCELVSLAPCGECEVEVTDCGADGQESEDWINGCEAGYKPLTPGE